MKKQRQSKVARVELRAGGELRGPEKPGWSPVAWQISLEINEEQQQNEERQQK